MWELDHKEGWELKNCCFWTVILEKTLESPLVCKKIKPVNPKENQPWIFIGRTDAEAETPMFWHLMRRANPLEKTLLLRKKEDRRRGWQRIRWLYVITNSMDMSLSNLRRWWRIRKPLCCSPQSCKALGTTAWLNKDERRRIKAPNKYDAMCAFTELYI